jgi:hypothetical protein
LSSVGRWVSVVIDSHALPVRRQPLYWNPCRSRRSPHSHPFRPTKARTAFPWHWSPSRWLTESVPALHPSFRISLLHTDYLTSMVSRSSSHFLPVLCSLHFHHVGQVCSKAGSVPLQCSNAHYLQQTTRWRVECLT